MPVEKREKKEKEKICKQKSASPLDFKQEMS